MADPGSSVAEFLEDVQCPICGVDECRVIYPSRRRSMSSAEEFRPSGDTPLEDPLVRCRRCGMQYVNPRFSSEIVLEGYASTVDETFASQVAGRELTFRRCLSMVQALWGQAPGRLLDIGTASGAFLKVAKDAGWEVAGCEPNHWLRRWCQERYGIALRPGTIFEGRYPDRSFDVVTLWDVLEHTPDPLSVLRECERILAPRGVLAINYPDIGSWIARAMGRRWVFLISVHNYYFTRRTMCAILRLVGMKPVMERPHFQRLELDYILFRAERLLGPLARAARRLASTARIGSAQVPYWIGQTLVVAKRHHEGAQSGADTQNQ